MSREMGRDDFIISARSVFLNKGNRQKFSLLTLIIISIVILSLEFFKSGPVNQIRMITKDIIIKSSYVASVPFKSISKTYSTIADHFNMYEEYEKLKKAEIKKQNLILENNFFKEENQRLKKLIDEKNLYNDEFYITKVLLDQKSPYLRSGTPKEVNISEEDTAEALNPILKDIVSAIKKALENTPPELSADLVDMGLTLTGGGSLLNNNDKRFSKETGLPVNVADDPLSCVAIGTGKALDQEETFSSVLSEY